MRRENAKDVLLERKLFRGCFNDDIDVAHGDVGGGGEDAVLAVARFKRGEVMTFHGVLVKRGYGGHAAHELIETHIAQNHGKAARAHPLRDTCAHDTRANDGGSIHGSRRPLRFLRALLEHEEAQ